MREYFPEPKSLGKVKVELDLSNYATKTDFKNKAGIDTSSFGKKVYLTSLKSNVNKWHIDKQKNLPTNLHNLKSKVDKLDIDKLLPAPVDLSKLSHAVKKDVVKEDLYNAKIKNIEDKIPDITNLANKTTLNGKINEVKGDIPSSTSLATKTARNAVKNKIPSVSNLVTKTNYKTRFNEIEKKITYHNHDKYITIPEFDWLTSETFDARLK